VPDRSLRLVPYPDRDADAPFSRSYSDNVPARAIVLEARARELADWEHRLDQREQRLDKRAAALDDALGVEPAWTAPAEAIRCQFDWYLHVVGDPPEMLAKGLDLEPEWVKDILAGLITEVDLDHVQRLCESLHCNPFDLWGSHVGRTLLHAYGPELWPTDTQALTGGYRDPEPPRTGPDLPPPTPPGLEL
jgi:hypothetical protein